MYPLTNIQGLIFCIEFFYLFLVPFDSKFLWLSGGGGTSFKGGREGNQFHCVVLQGGVFYCIVYYWVARYFATSLE